MSRAARIEATRLALRRSVKQVAANCLDRTGARRRLASATRRAAGGTRVLVVGFHRVVPDFDHMRDRVIPSLLTSTRTFERQLAILARSYRFVRLGDALSVLSGRSSSDRDLCVVAFDDAYAAFAEHALPVLRRLSVPAALYVPRVHRRIAAPRPPVHARQIAARSALLASAVPAPAEVEPALAEALTSHPAAAVGRLLERWSRRRVGRWRRCSSRYSANTPRSPLRTRRSSAGTTFALCVRPVWRSAGTRLPTHASIPSRLRKRLARCDRRRSGWNWSSTPPSWISHIRTAGTRHGQSARFGTRATAAR